MMDKLTKKKMDLHYPRYTHTTPSLCCYNTLATTALLRMGRQLLPNIRYRKAGKGGGTVCNIKSSEYQGLFHTCSQSLNTIWCYVIRG